MAGKTLLRAAFGGLRNRRCQSEPCPVGLDDALHQHSKCQGCIHARMALVLPTALLKHSCCRNFESNHPLQVAACDPGGGETLQLPDKLTATTQTYSAIFPAGVIVAKKLERGLDWPLQTERRILPAGEFQDILVRCLPQPPPGFLDINLPLGSHANATTTNTKVLKRQLYRGQCSLIPVDVLLHFHGAGAHFLSVATYLNPELH
mmetsp:Transcript_2193/g.6197  ORF Transcript_2193/g.6197 Transcript_2193/m.6197 type:complete len:205 (+) Transcript_2193:804-1418(+)